LRIGCVLCCVNNMVASARYSRLCCSTVARDIMTDAGACNSALSLASAQVPAARSGLSIVRRRVGLFGPEVARRGAAAGRVDRLPSGFQSDVRSGKLKNWKSDALHRLAPARIPVFQFSSFPASRLPPVPGGGHPCRILSRPFPQAAFFFNAPSMARDALAEASCCVVVDRCEYRCVTFGVECPRICCTS